MARYYLDAMEPRMDDDAFAPDEVDDLANQTLLDGFAARVHEGERVESTATVVGRSTGDILHYVVQALDQL